MHKLSGRVSNTIYGKDLSHIFIYDRSTTEIDHSNCKATILYFDNKKISDLAVWSLIKELSSIPLMDLWMVQIIDMCHQDCYIDHIDGFGGVSALIVKLDKIEFETSITKMIRSKHLLVA